MTKERARQQSVQCMFLAIWHYVAREALTSLVSETATGGAPKPGGPGGPGVHNPVGYDAVYAEGAPRPSWVVLGHGGEVCVILPFVFLQSSMCLLGRATQAV